MAGYWANRRVCVTGGSGFLGFHLVRQLLQLGALVRVLCLPPRGSHPLYQLPQLEYHFGDLLDAPKTRNALAGCEVIFHTAGLVAAWGSALSRMHTVHVEGTRTVLANVPAGARVVHTSSVVAVGSGRRGEILTEDSPFNLAGLKVDYVAAKRAAEEVALAAGDSGQDVVVTNPGYLVGPEDFEPSVMGRVCVRFWKGRLPLCPPGGFNFADVRDVARGHLLAAEFGCRGRRYILGGADHSMRDFMGLLARAGEMKPRALPRLPAFVLEGLAALSEARAWWTGREPYPSFQHVRLNRYHWFYSSRRAEVELGYRCRPLSETLEDSFRWFRSQGMIGVRGFGKWWLRPEPDQAA